MTEWSQRSHTGMRGGCPIQSEWQAERLPYNPSNAGMLTNALASLRARRRSGTGPRCGNTSREFDRQHRRAGALPSVESFWRTEGRLVSQHEPAKVAGWIVQPRLYVGNHLR